VGKFFGIIIEDEKREIQQQKWNESAQKMHGRSLVTKRKAVRQKEPYRADGVEMDEVDSSLGLVFLLMCMILMPKCYCMVCLMFKLNGKPALLLR
jgi:hypothetical protein